MTDDYNIIKILRKILCKLLKYSNIAAHLRSYILKSPPHKIPIIKFN